MDKIYIQTEERLFFEKRDLFDLESSKQEYCKKYNLKRLTVFEVKCGDIVYITNLFRGSVYDPHPVEHEVTSIYWNKGVTDFTNFYAKI